MALKNYVLTTPQGLILDFVVYQGAKTFTVDHDHGPMGLGGSVIMHLSARLQPGTSLYCDCFFTNVRLLDAMLERNIYVTGTVMKNRILKEVRSKIVDDKTLAEQGRGSAALLVRQDHKVCFVKWHDNKAITLLSSKHGIEPTDTCRRWSKKEKKYIEVKRPMVIKHYNEKMGGIDLIDRMIFLYRLKARTKK